jgi:hypothetical protein
LEKVADRFAKNSDFHLEMVTAFTSNFCDNWAKVSWPLTASRATFALKLGVNLRRVCLVYRLVKLSDFLTKPLVQDLGSIKLNISMSNRINNI